jgi:hypothetical protein
MSTFKYAPFTEGRRIHIDAVQGMLQHPKLAHNYNDLEVKLPTILRLHMTGVQFLQGVLL